MLLGPEEQVTVHLLISPLQPYRSACCNAYPDTDLVGIILPSKQVGIVGYRGRIGYALFVKLLGTHVTTVGTLQPEDLRHFLLDCRALAPIRASFPTLFEPTSLPNASKDTHMRFILNHADHTMVVKCLLSFEAHRKACITLVEEHRLSEIIPSDHLLPIDYNLVRIIAAENALLVESDDGSDFD